MWNEHVGCKQHRDNITRKKSFSDSASITSASKKCLSKNILKRHADSSTDSPKPKILRGILKNKAEIIANHGHDYAGSIPIASPSSFSSECEPSTSIECKMDIDIEEGVQIDSSTGLPEGFFDDPHQDAKARNVDYKDPKEEEWEKFQREIREQTALSTQLQEEDQVEASTDRIIEEIDEQMHNWSRMLSLEIKKEKIHESRNQVAKDQDDDSSYGSEEEFEEFLDWRTKSSFM